MNDLDSSLEWVAYAEEDFIVAKSALRRKKPLATASCFHSQQCAEKYSKQCLLQEILNSLKLMTCLSSIPCAILLES